MHSSIVNKLFLVFSFFPFVSPYPIGSDIQPLAGVAAAIVVFLHVYREGKIERNLLAIITIPFVLLSYNNVFSDSIVFDFGKVVSLMFGSFIIVGFYYSKKYLTSSLFTAIVSIYFIFTVLLLLFTGPMIEIQNLLIRDTNSTDFSYRGVATLVTEPGLFGGLIVFFYMISDYLHENKLMTSRNKRIVGLMLFFMLVMTKSGTGYLYFIIYISFKCIFGNYQVIYKFLSVCLLLCILAGALMLAPSLEESSLGRGASILIQLSDPTTLVQTDSSILSRVVDIWLGIISVLSHPFGVGNTAVIDSAKELMLVTPFVKSFYDATGKEFGFNSSFAYLTVAYGLIFWAYILYLTLYFSKSNAVWIFFSMLYLSVSYSAAFPAIWILLALYTRRDISNRNIPN